MLFNGMIQLFLHLQTYMDLSEKQPISLSKEFDDVLNILEYTSNHYFVTGRAGTGKSTLLQLFRSTSRKKIAVLAPTGIAALNVKGQTLHSFFGFPPRMIDKVDIFKKKDYKFYKKVDTIIIDEVSMVRADMLDNIDYFLRLNREVDQPFGGVQMLFFGDLFQLPPVIASEFEKQYFREKYASAYFFSANIIPFIDLQMIELNQVYRQDEKHFIRLLDNIRQNAIDYDDMEDLNQRHVALPEDKKYIVYLCARNATADAINQTEIEKLDTEKFVFNAKTEGEFNPQLYPTEGILVLKRGAQIMFVKNDPQKQFVNGTIGTIRHMDNDEITADILDEHGNEKMIKVDRQTWENVKYKSDPQVDTTIKAEIIGTFTQYPLKLAWAITIHKSQGKTFERVIIDLGGGAFESGQTYVALSRCKKLSGIYLKKPITGRDIFIDPAVVDFYEDMKRR
jgi:ATP-dependent DNA helicase PIF1